MTVGYPSELETAWLIRQGVSDTALLEPTYIRAARVTFLGDNTFEFDPDGVRALLFNVQEGEVEIDWVAWQPNQGRLATWQGAAFALGQDAIFNPATYFMGLTLRVHRTPMEWLLSGREGIVIVKPALTYVYLRNVARLSFADPSYARKVERWLQPPKPQVELLVEVSAEMAAAASACA